MSKFLLAALLLMLAASAVAEDIRPLQTGTIGASLAERELKNYQRMRQLDQLELAAGFEDFPMTSDIFDINYKSPSRGFLYSMTIPGTGQLYTGSKTKGVFFMGIEALAWSAWYIFHNKGVNQDDDNKELARSYWDPERYQNYLIEVHGITDDRDTSYITDAIFTHHLPTTQTQQYFEMIGKYDQFNYGWTDTDYRTGDSTSAYREQYLLDRDKANKDFDRAKLGAIVAIANHLFSAFDAALSARRYNRQQDSFAEFSLKARLAKYEGHSMPKLILSYKF